jgi:hypothetical protein
MTYSYVWLPVTLEWLSRVTPVATVAVTEACRAAQKEALEGGDGIDSKL